MVKYQDNFPDRALLSSDELHRTAVSQLLTLNYFSAGPGSIPTRVFDQHNILINLSGSSFRLEDSRDDVNHEFLFKTNDIVVTPAGMKIGWRWRERCEIIVIVLEPLEFEAFALREVGVLLNSEQLNDIPHFRDDDISEAAAYLYQALDEKALGYEVMFEAFARVFLVKLIQKYGQTQSDGYAFKKGFSSTQFKKVFDFVKTNFNKPIALEDLAKIAGISTYHFSRLFKQATRATPLQFVQAQRVEEAKKLLRNSDLPLAEVGQRCGFSDQSHFSRVFKQYTTVSPKSFRKTL